MSGLLGDFAGTFVATIRDVLPIAAVVIGFQLFVLRRPIPNLRRVLIGFVYVLVGLTLFLVNRLAGDDAIGAEGNTDGHPEGYCDPQSPYADGATGNFLGFHGNGIQ